MSQNNRIFSGLAGNGFASIALLVFCMRLLPAAAQTIVHPPVKTNGSGGNTYDGPEFIRYAATRDTQDRRIDLFMGDWRESMPRHEHGSLVLRDVLTRGDNFTPPQKGAVLQSANFLAYGRLQPNDSTTPAKLEGEQEIYYVLGGSGEITAGGRTAALREDTGVLMPAGLEFSMKNTGTEDLTMYVINEPVPEGFTPRKDMIVTDERTVPIRTPLLASPYTIPGASGHWAHIVRDLFSRTDGLATIGDIITVTINPLSMGEPHPHQPGHEEIWADISGTSLALLGTELRVQQPGMAYMLRPDGQTLHSNINSGDTPVKFLWFSTSTGYSAKK
jgi:mannose-6-phosphate isomerase-like protein (cupin superfamily)